MLTNFSPKTWSVGLELFSNISSIVGWVSHNFSQDSASSWVVGPSPDHEWVDEQESWPHVTKELDFWNQLFSYEYPE